MHVYMWYWTGFLSDVFLTIYIVSTDGKSGECEWNTLLIWMYIVFVCFLIHFCYFLITKFTKEPYSNLKAIDGATYTSKFNFFFLQIVTTMSDLWSTAATYQHLNQQQCNLDLLDFAGAKSRWYHWRHQNSDIVLHVDIV